MSTSQNRVWGFRPGGLSDDSPERLHMRLFEYQGKELFRKYGIRTPRSRLANDPAEALRAVGDLGLPVVIKSQVLTGGRGKAGGVVVVDSEPEAESEARRLFSLRIGGEQPVAVLVEEVCPHAAEMYLSITLDRGRRQFVAIASRVGGVDVESIAEGLVRETVPLDGLTGEIASSIGAKLDLSGAESGDFRSTVLGLERLSREEECELAEINPLAVDSRGNLVALDSKVILDDNAIFRHPEFSRLAPEDPLEAEAAKMGFAFVRLEGEVAVVGNGAGLVLSTMDMLADAGGRAACFLDLGGGAQRERVEAALRLVRRLPNAKKILINIFGGITRTTDVAEGLRQVLSEAALAPLPPIFARISGAEEAEARDLLAGSEVRLFPTPQEAVFAATGGSVT